MTWVESLFGVRGKTVLVTGGSRGIGELIAEAFVRAGAKVYITARKEAQCVATAKRLGDLGFCEALPADLSNPDAIRGLAAALHAQTPALHVLINNAGIAWGAPLEEYPLEAWDKVFSINVRAVFQLTRDLLPMLRAVATPADPARVINLGSIAGSRVAKDTFAYAYGASKAAVHHLTAMLAMELTGSHITVNAVAPGVFPSRMTAMRIGDSTMLELASAGTPLQRAGTIEDVGGTCLYLASRSGAYVTGAVIPLDGGQHTQALPWRADDASA